MVSSPYKCAAIVNGTAKFLISDADYSAVKLFNGYSEGLLTFASVCCVISMIIGIPGNLITVVALAKYKKVHNATATFIMNMSFTDLLLLCISPPLTISKLTTKSWRHGRVLCELYPLVKHLLVAVSIFSIIAVTINRYILIGHPRLYRKMYKKRNIAIMLAVIWLSPLLTVIPTYLGKWGCYNLDQAVGSCTVVRDQNNRSSKHFQFVSVLGLPGILIILFYTRIYFIVRKSKRKTRKTQNPINPLPIENSDTEESTTNNTSLINEYPDNREKVIVNSKSEFSKTTTSAENIDTYKDKLPQPPRIRRNVLQRSMILLKSSLPTRKDRRLGSMIVAILVAFCLGYVPTVISEMLRGITLQQNQPPLVITSLILLNFCSCFNPVIYVVMSKEYREAYKNMFKCSKRMKK
ncbi:G-protein coupled receptor moody isoform X2 [Bicyclus anynana]|uniref:G-protein coupled receptor moody isoform X2 n=1 Tax=Bicyclus anynana TaxID=110368 RepID=A0A6J1NKY5_BICAN|nr:G-protein coupled receptor moody isoform X2 [Bicyclus anynana]